MVAEEKSASSNWPQYTGFSVYVAQSAEKKSVAAPFVSEHTAGGDGGAIGGAGGDGGAGARAKPLAAMDRTSALEPAATREREALGRFLQQERSVDDLIGALVI